MKRLQRFYLWRWMWVMGMLSCLLPSFAQVNIQGTIRNASTEQGISAEIYLPPLSQTFTSDSTGKFVIPKVKAGNYELIIFSPAFELFKKKISIKNQDLNLDIPLNEITYELTEVVISQRREELFALRRLKEIEGTAIYAGKKNEVVVLDQLTVNLAANNPRQIYSQVTGLNIYESNDAGLQLNVGGRGLDPNRTSNFNTRQNGYDISADVLGYPESYYTPPAAALSEIQIIRGAASLQYGTQFGGLINFVIKQPLKTRKLEWTSRQGVGSFGLLTSFNSVTGSVGKFSYYTYFNYKQGNSFRPNSEFRSSNFYADLHYQLGKKTELELELTYLYYLAQQAGGLTDAQFYEDPTFSNRERNWFAVDWRLAALKINHEFSDKTQLNVNLFGLDATRNALGFRTNRVSQTDVLSSPRDLIIGDFLNGGMEARLLSKYKIGNKDAVFLIGNKLYFSRNSAIQGAGTNGLDADFSISNGDFPTYPNQSDFTFPNTNVALFGEHILYLTPKLSITPGIRWEYIRTESEGTFKRIDFDLAGNPIRDTTLSDDRIFDRSLVLFGVGVSYKPSASLELFGNISENYRSVTFSDIRIVNPSFQVDPNITDERGFTIDLGIRGRYKTFLSYELGFFNLNYDGRLGEVLRAETRINADGVEIETGRVIRFRGNIGRAQMYGLESLIDWNIRNTLFPQVEKLKLKAFVNMAFIGSEYVESEIPGVKGNQVEFIPLANIKTGLNFGWGNLLGSLQYTYLSEQFTDASNAPQDITDNQSGIRGAIPAYQIVDLSLSYAYKLFRLETGINNLLDASYFTRRATGYPGPGIIPSAPRSWYVVLQMRI
ncbi:MAG: TonB-dependent receptor [Bacteroidota bacterium]